MTAHIPSERLHALVLDNQSDAAATAHLSICAICRQQVEELKQLLFDLEIARLSQPTPAAFDRYQAMFSYVQTRPSSLQRFAQQLRARLTWDSRTQPALQGVRNATAHTYRQLYVATGAEIELMVERMGELRRVEGDLIDIGQDDAPTSALVELLDANGEIVHMVEADVDGLFHLENVAPGTYTIVITRPNAATIEVPALEVA
jgi:hypothetical protein